MDSPLGVFFPLLQWLMWTLNFYFQMLFYSLELFALQDCAVGLLFALLPVLGGTSGVLQGVMSMTKL
jgi:hypothetical protein